MGAIFTTVELRRALSRGKPGVTAAAAMFWTGLMFAGFSNAASAANATDCRRIGLVDADTGASVRGAEDMVVDRPTGLLFIAAVDRWALEDAIQKNHARLPQGAVYVLPLRQLAAAEGTLAIRSAARSFSAANAFHPQGIGLRRDGDSVTVAVVNRRYRRTPANRSRGWEADPAIEVFSFSGDRLEHQRSARHALVCHPNDVAVLPSGALAVTNDRSCDTRLHWMEDILGLRNASVVLLEVAGSEAVRGQLLADDIGFANGIVAASDNRLYVAATREQAIRLYRLTHAARGKWSVQPLGRLAIDDAPDNLSWADDRNLLVAVHPGLFSLALYRYRWLGRDKVASRVIHLSADGRETVVFDDPAGELISAATVAVGAAGRLVAGSVTDSGLLICNYKI